VLLETLPLGNVDPGPRAPELPLDLHSIAADARLLDEIGYDGLVVEENQGRSVRGAGAGGADDTDAEARHLGRDSVPAQSDRDRNERVDAAEAVARAAFPLASARR